MKMKATPVSETSVDFQRATLVYMTQLFNDGCEIPERYVSLFQSSHLKPFVISAEPSSGVRP
jgi:hypothetical protein